MEHQSQITQRYYSGLAALIDILADLARDKIRELPPADLNYLESCCQTAQISLNGITAASAIAFYNMDKDERASNGIDMKMLDFAATNAETNELLYTLSHDLLFHADGKKPSS